MHATPPEREPRPGAVPALPMWGRTQLPNAERAKHQALIFIIFFIITDGSSGKIQICSIFFLFIILKVIIISGGKDKTSHLPEEIKCGRMRREKEREGDEKGRNWPTPEGTRGRDTKKRQDREKCGRSE